MATLQELEQHIITADRTWYLAGKALATISRDRLFQPEYQTFSQYCQQKLKLTKGRIYQFTRAAEAVDSSQIATNASPEAIQAKLNDLGLSEAAIRPLCVSKRSPEQQGELLDSIVSKANELGKIPSVTIAKSVVRESEKLQREANRKPVTPKTVTKGDIWQLGKHKLYCCDSRYWRPDEAATMAFADPPYNGKVDRWDEDFTWGHDWLEDFAALVFVTPGIGNLQTFLKKTKLTYRWEFNHLLVNGISQPNAFGRSNKNTILLFSKRKTSLVNNASVSDFRSDTVDQSQTEDTDHKGRKPLQLVQWLVRLATSEGDLVVDPFLGSGTTLIASEIENRVCHGCEIDPEYCSEIISRWESQTGQEAEKIGEFTELTPGDIGRRTKKRIETPDSYWLVLSSAGYSLRDAIERVDDLVKEVNKGKMTREVALIHLLQTAQYPGEHLFMLLNKILDLFPETSWEKPIAYGENVWDRTKTSQEELFSKNFYPIVRAASEFSDRLQGLRKPTFRDRLVFAESALEPVVDELWKLERSLRHGDIHNELDGKVAVQVLIEVFREAKAGSFGREFFEKVGSLGAECVRISDFSDFPDGLADQDAGRIKRSPEDFLDNFVRRRSFCGSFCEAVKASEMLIEAKRGC